MDLLFLVISSIFIFLYLDKRTKIGTIFYTICSIIILFLFLFVSNSNFVSSLISKVFGEYYYIINNSLCYIDNLAYISYNSLLILQYYALIIMFLASFVLFKKVASLLKKVKTKGHTFNRRQTYQKVLKTKCFSRNKIFLLICRLNN